MNFYKPLLIIILSLLLLQSTTYSQIDTLMLLNKVNQNQTSVKNSYIEFIKSGSLEESDFMIKKKVWFVRDKSLENIISIRVENYQLNDIQPESITILNEKQKFCISPAYKRSDLYSFNLLKDDDLDNFFMQIEQENLPSFMIKEGNIGIMLYDFIKEIRQKENVFFEIVNDTNISGIPCFGYKITDYDKNNGYIADKSGKGNEKYADKTIEYTYLSKKDTCIILKLTKYFYINPNAEKVISEHILNYEFDNKKNMSIHLYSINSDTLKNYFQTRTKYNGNNPVSELSDFSVKKAPLFKGTTIDNLVFNLEEIKSKYILLGFWSSDCEECIGQMNALNKQYNELKSLGLTYIAINAKETYDNALKEFLNANYYDFQLVFSQIAGKLYMNNQPPFYVLLDEKQNIKEVFYELNQEIVDKIKRKLR